MNKAIQDRLTLNAKLATDVLVAFVREEVQKAGFQDVVLGLSGGIDSALAVYLCVMALGKEQVHPVLMPYQTSSKSSLTDAEAVVQDLGLKSLTVSITTQVDPYFELIEELTGEAPTALRKGNKMARERMTVLFDLSAYYRALVIGTSNKTELLLGYGTQFGDMASAINPLGDLYKYQVRQLSAYVGVPKSILEKPPSADLWESQTDEGELGFGYDEADEILIQLIDERKPAEDIIASGYDASFVNMLTRRIAMNHYKRKPPLIAKLSERTIGIDFRYLRDWGL